MARKEKIKIDINRGAITTKMIKWFDDKFSITDLSAHALRGIVQDVYAFINVGKFNKTNYLNR